MWWIDVQVLKWKHILNLSELSKGTVEEGKKDEQEVSWKESAHEGRRLFPMVGVSCIILHERNNENWGAECPNEVSVVYRQVDRRKFVDSSPCWRETGFLQSGLLERLLREGGLFSGCVSFMTSPHPTGHGSGASRSPSLRHSHYSLSQIRLVLLVFFHTLPFIIKGARGIKCWSLGTF